MILLDKFRAKVNEGVFGSDSRKRLRISGHNFVYVSKDIGISIDEWTLEWNEPISLPPYYGRIFQFEIFQEREDSFNPERLALTLTGQFSIFQPPIRIGTYEIRDISGKAVGIVTTEVGKSGKGSLLKSKNSALLLSSSLNRTRIQQEGQKILVVSSIVASLPDQKFKRAYAVLKVGEQTAKSSIVRSRAGELVFIDTLEVEQGDADEATLEIYAYESENSSSKLIASSTIPLHEELGKKYKLFSPDNSVKPNGDAYIDIASEHKSVYTSNKVIRKILQQSEFFSKSPPTKSRVSSSGEVYSSRVSPGQQPRVKRVSVVNHNHEIVFPKEKRFSIHTDRPSQKVSYLQERTFDFKDNQANKYYKGASIGYGGKHDFTNARKANPGVGQYKLPSIWDRY